MKTIIDILNTNSGAIQAIMVIILVAVTIWYAISTKEMAILMHQEYKLNSRPFLVVSRDVIRLLAQDNDKVIQLRFSFINVGNVPVEYYAEKFTLEKNSVNPKKVNTILFPKQEGTLSSKLYEAKTNINGGIGLRGSIKIIFWTDGIASEKYYFQRDFQLVEGNTFILDESFGRLE